jgi:hypothetical protein
VTCLLSCCWDVHAFLVPVLGHERGLPASAIGSILSAFGIGAAAVRFLAPLVAAKLREWRCWWARWPPLPSVRPLSADALSAGGSLIGAAGVFWAAG